MPAVYAGAVWPYVSSLCHKATFRHYDAYQWFRVGRNGNELCISNWCIYAWLMQRPFTWKCRDHVSRGTFSSKATEPECLVTMLYATESVPRLHLSIYVGRSKTFSARFWTISNQFLGWRCSIYTTSEITTWILATSFVVVLNFRNSRRLMRHFPWVFT